MPQKCFCYFTSCGDKKQIHFFAIFGQIAERCILPFSHESICYSDTPELLAHLPLVTIRDFLAFGQTAIKAAISTDTLLWHFGVLQSRHRSSSFAGNLLSSKQHWRNIGKSAERPLARFHQVRSQKQFDAQRTSI